MHTAHSPQKSYYLTSLRHRRTHDRGDGSDGAYGSYSGEEEDYEGEDQLGSLEEASPNSENGYLPTRHVSGLPTVFNSMTMNMASSGMSAPAQLINAQR